MACICFHSLLHIVLLELNPPRRNDLKLKLLIYNSIKRPSKYLTKNFKKYSEIEVDYSEIEGDYSEFEVDYSEFEVDYSEIEVVKV